MALFRALWNYRGFILGSVKREFQIKYRNSLLGAAWNVINPLAMILVYTVIFSQIMKARLEGVESTFGFGIYLCSGMLTWALFAEIATRSQTTFIENANLLKKISFPRLCLPAIVILSSLLNFSIIFGLFTGFLVLTGNFPGIAYLALFPLLAIQILFATGLGMTLGIFNVFFRDIGQAFGVVLQFWFWFTPIVYPANILPESIKGILSLNPMSSLITGYQGIVVYGAWPQWGSLLPVTLLSLALCAVGWKLFRAKVGEIVDEL
jgi:lipopolysaccharide transport system permease protein